MTGTRTKELTLIMWEKVRKLYENKTYYETFDKSEHNSIWEMYGCGIITDYEFHHIRSDSFLCTYFYNLSSKSHCKTRCKMCPLDKKCKSLYSNLREAGNSLYFHKEEYREKILSYIDIIINAINNWTPID